MSPRHVPSARGGQEVGLCGTAGIPAAGPARHRRIRIREAVLSCQGKTAHLSHGLQCPEHAVSLCIGGPGTRSAEGVTSMDRPRS